MRSSFLPFTHRTVKRLLCPSSGSRPSRGLCSDDHRKGKDISNDFPEKLDSWRSPDDNAVREGSESKQRSDIVERIDERLDFEQNSEKKFEFERIFAKEAADSDKFINFIATNENSIGQNSDGRMDFDMKYQERSDHPGYIPEEVVLGFPPDGKNENEQTHHLSRFRKKQIFYEEIARQADQVFEILQQDGPGFNTRLALDELHLELSNALVREVLFRILVSINDANKSRIARLAYKFFVWSDQQERFKHNSSTYNLTMKVFAEAKELKAMWRLLDDMTEKGLPITARTFNLLICICGEAGMLRKVVERFIKSKNFNYRPFKHSFNAILHSLLTINQYRLVEWVYQKMLLEGYSPDVLTYNLIMRAKYMLGKLDHFHRLLDEMGQNGFAPDLHTYNLLLHVLGKGDKPLAALNLLNYMDDVGCHPSVLHFTTLIDGLSRAGNTDACRYFYDEMVKKGSEPDIVCFTVLITGYVIAGEFQKAQELFDDMLTRGQLPNVFTYNAMLRGLCISGKYEEACSMLKDMESRGCTPNFSVYSTLVGRLRNAGKVSKADEIISYMAEKGHYVHLLSRFKGYKRC